MDIKSKVIIIGTTFDYIQWLIKAQPDEVFFLNNPEESVCNNIIGKDKQLICDLNDLELTLNLLLIHLKKYCITLNGIFCFDDEFMDLTAFLAIKLNLPYHLPQAIKNCRDKYLAKSIWQEKRLPTPYTKLLHNIQEAKQFMHDLEGKSCVIKPINATGSELVFKCETTEDIQGAVKTINTELKSRKNKGLYNICNGLSFLGEEYIEGIEFSCDFILENGKIEIIRLSRKQSLINEFFGTTLSYETFHINSAPFGEDKLKATLLDAATSLGIKRAICMVDFIYSNGVLFLLEIAPRPGGDCIPWLLKSAFNFDILSFCLKFAKGDNALKKIKYNNSCSYVGLRIFANKAGKLLDIDINVLKQDRRVTEIYIPEKSKHIKLPPKDYFSRNLGHIVYQLELGKSIEEQNNELINFIKFKWEIHDN